MKMLLLHLIGKVIKKVNCASLFHSLIVAKNLYIIFKDVIIVFIASLEMKTLFCEEKKKKLYLYLSRRGNNFIKRFH